MLQNETVALPFPPSFVFEDVDQQVLEHEDVAAPVTREPGAWQDYMSKMLRPERAIPRPCC